MVQYTQIDAASRRSFKTRCLSEETALAKWHAIEYYNFHIEDNSADQIDHYYDSLSYHEVPLPDERFSTRKITA